MSAVQIQSLRLTVVFDSLTDDIFDCLSTLLPAPIEVGVLTVSSPAAILYYEGFPRCWRAGRASSMDEEGYAILCSKPTFQEGDEYTPEERSTESYEPTSYVQRFRVQNKRFKTQYSHLYYNRLETLRNPVREAAERKWGMHLLSCAHGCCGCTMSKLMISL